ncbi:MAG: ComEC family competence protein [Flavobacteriaceae bacterium]|nr:ComEC family competence protein [Flavobacteriaceae bacterium]
MVITLCVLAITYYSARKKIIQNSLFTIITFLSFIFIGVASVTFGSAFNKKNNYTSHLSDTDNTSILIIDKVLKSNLYYNKYFAKVVTLNSEKTQGKILLNVAKDSIVKKLNVDDKIVISHRFDSIKRPLNPYQFNYKNYLVKQQVHHQISLKNTEYLLLKNDNHSLKGWAFFVRKKINTALKKHGFKGDELAIINALLLGQRQEISKDIIQNYQNAGAVHILAVSGLHVGIILLMLTFLLKPLEKLKHGTFIKLVLIIILLWTFAIVAGLSASIVRSVTMFTAIAVAITLKQSKNIYKTLIISIFFLLLFNPNYLFDVGFQLSYLAVFFIVWTQPMLYKLWKPKLKIVDYFWQLLTVSVAAQLGVLPLSLFYFHQFPGLFFVANLLIIPFLGIILGLGILVIALALLNILPNFISKFYENIISLLNLTVEWVGNQESFLFQNISFTITSVILYFFIVVLFFKWIEAKKPIYIRFALIAIVGFQLNLIAEKYISNTNREFVIFNKTRQSMLGLQKEGKLQLYHTLDSAYIMSDYAIKAYLIGSKTEIISKNQPKNVYALNNKKVLVIDSLGVYSTSNFFPNYILLRESPNINLERLIKTLKPELIIADASNYKSHILRWQKTCKIYNIKFHYTVKDGAFIKKL